ncbi:MAG: hypothetical protein ACYDD6_03215 [Acidimicrobiales bacterium]
MKVVAWLGGLALVGGLIVLSVAGATAALAVLLTGAAVVGMIALGNILGGRTTPNRPPRPVAPAGGDVTPAASDEAPPGGACEGPGGGTMQG